MQAAKPFRIARNSAADPHGFETTKIARQPQLFNALKFMELTFASQAHQKNMAWTTVHLGHTHCARQTTTNVGEEVSYQKPNFSSTTDEEIMKTADPTTWRGWATVCVGKHTASKDTSSAEGKFLLPSKRLPVNNFNTMQVHAKERR